MKVKTILKSALVFLLCVALVGYLAFPFSGYVFCYYPCGYVVINLRWP